MKLGLGTVQFGLDYGVANPGGRTSEDEVRRILAAAADGGIEVVDTAAAYGEAEAVLGRCLQRPSPFRIVTKTRPLRERSDGSTAGHWIQSGFVRSLERLGMDRVDALLVHHVADLLGPEGRDLASVLADLNSSGRAGKIGLSTYGGAEVDAALAVHDFDLLQLPLNVLDQRLVAGGKLRQLRQRGIEVHVRSVFLQGLLLMQPSSVPAYFAPIRSQLGAWHSALETRGMTPLEGAFAFVRALDVDVVLVGVDNALQLAANQAAFAAAANCDLDFAAFAVDDEAFINPSRWQLAE